MAHLTAVMDTTDCEVNTAPNAQGQIPGRRDPDGDHPFPRNLDPAQPLVQRIKIIANNSDRHAVNMLDESSTTTLDLARGGCGSEVSASDASDVA
ncbi:unnamed protein product [Phytophthora fragariaefolia]|uniref:Unnamed protein product n=1 Tax=Phytophthora fragariaefolia TaxID=1490495 RepID=A0A9W7DBP2_9STRA|nr:unnamed protein product [Phytophthora fragariaefolia]